MNTIEQAREVSSRIWNAGYVDESATIDALIAELEKVTREAHENKDKARWANAELERIKSQEPVAWMTQSGNPVLYKSAERAVLYGWNPLFLAAGAQPVQQEPAAWEHCFVDPSKKILSYTKTCAGFPPRDDAYQINPLYAQPVQAQERKPLFGDFLAWAIDNGYDTANTCNSNTGKWICLNPMTADLWKAWQAAHGIKEQL